MRERKMSMLEFIAILFIDIGFTTAAERCGWLEREFGKRYADELTPAQQHQAIERLKVIKDSVRDRQKADYDDIESEVA